jgi:uracil-DNA glycosylase
VPTAPIPARLSIRALQAAAKGCRACDLWRKGTQTVFGEGQADADVMLIAEQPGNDEDQAGHPFVGPAGRILSKALKDAGIDRSRTYITNVVKHFKWEPRGKRRIHAKPNSREISACRPWLDAELEVVHPRAIVCLGRTAAQALLGRSFKVTKQRGKFVDSPLAPLVTATVHPSSILRERDPTARRQAMKNLIRDLSAVSKSLKLKTRK